MSNMLKLILLLSMFIPTGAIIYGHESSNAMKTKRFALIVHSLRPGVPLDALRNALKNTGKISKIIPIGKDGNDTVYTISDEDARLGVAIVDPSGIVLKNWDDPMGLATGYALKHGGKCYLKGNDGWVGPASNDPTYPVCVSF